MRAGRRDNGRKGREGFSGMQGGMEGGMRETEGGREEGGHTLSPGLLIAL